jgi:hypothetical protein
MSKPEVKVIKYGKDKIYIGNFVNGCAFITEIPTISNASVMGNTVTVWDDVSRDEGWRLIEEWIQQV